MIKRFKLITFFLCAAIFFAGCYGQSFPKETLAQDMQALIYKETGISPKIEIVGKTIYVDIMLSGFSSNQESIINEEMTKMQNAVGAVSRVMLSSDSDAQFVVITAYDSPEYNIALRSVLNIADFKGLVSWRVRRSDYIERQVFQIEGAPFAKEFFENRTDLTQQDYTGMAILTQITAASGNNLLANAVMQGLKLKYLKTEDGTIFYQARNDMDVNLQNILPDIFKTQVLKQVEKYKLNISAVKIINTAGEVILNVALQ
jgi:hypothetical protein